MTARPFVLLDRDGTLIVEHHYLSEPDQVELIPGAADGLRLLADAGFGIVVITNQSAVGRGLIDEDTLNRIHRRIMELLSSEGVHLDGIYYCPHTPDDNCPCRKPRTGLVDAAREAHDFNPRRSFMIGDNVADIELGQNVGARTILVQTGYGARVAEEGLIEAHYVVPDLGSAARLIADLGVDGSTTE